MLVDRQMQSKFTPELHRWGIRGWPPTTCRLSTSRSFNHHREGNRNYIQKRASKKWKKWNLFISLIDLIMMKTDCEIGCDFARCTNVVLGLCKEIFARKHTATHKPTSAQRLIVTTMTQKHTHTPDNRLWSPRPVARQCITVFFLRCPYYS